jgi:hypothetical protein
MFRRTRSTRRRLRGHSLLEAMLAGSILLIGLAGVVSALGSGQAINTHTRRLGSGVLVAERTMERLLLLPVGHSDLTTTSHTGPTMASMPASTGQVRSRRHGPSPPAPSMARSASTSP